MPVVIWFRMLFICKLLFVSDPEPCFQEKFARAGWEKHGRKKTEPNLLDRDKRGVRELSGLRQKVVTPPRMRK
jgi:hypothetical protein